MTFDDLRAVLIARDDLVRGGGATQEEILQAVSLLEDLPEDYRRFLTEFGWVAIGAFEIFGLGEDVPEYLNFLTVTLSERAEAGLSDQLVAVISDGGENLSCLDIGAHDAQGHTPLIYWDHEVLASAGVERVADSFSEWLVSLIQT